MNSRTLIFFVISAVCLSVAGSFLFYSFYIVKETQVIPMDMYIRDRMGFNLNNDSLHFGSMLPGGLAQREMLIPNKGTYPIEISIFTFGNISKYVTVSENNFILRPSETKSLIFVADTPASIGFGNYTGYAKIVIKRVI